MVSGCVSVSELFAITCRSNVIINSGSKDTVGFNATKFGGIYITEIRHADK